MSWREIGREMGLPWNSVYNAVSRRKNGKIERRQFNNWRPHYDEIAEMYRKGATPREVTARFPGMPIDSARTIRWNLIKKGCVVAPLSSITLPRLRGYEDILS
jgi:hypothetical protein